jgi:hypothetical protein
MPKRAPVVPLLHHGKAEVHATWQRNLAAPFALRVDSLERASQRPAPRIVFGKCQPRGDACEELAGGDGRGGEEAEAARERRYAHCESRDLGSFALSPGLRALL